MSDTSTTTLAAPVGERDHAIGPGTAPATLVVYGDYECPYTLLAMPVVQDLLGRFGERLRFVYRQFPLAKHPHAFAASEAAEAAGAQGKFWQMHEALLNHQDALEHDDLLRYAAGLGLDAARFERDLAGHAHAGRVQEDVEGGQRSGVTGTPTYFVNGALYQGDDKPAPLGRAIERALAGEAPAAP